MASFSLHSCLPSSSIHTLKPNSQKALIFISPTHVSFLKNNSKLRLVTSCSAKDDSASFPAGDNIPSNFCIIEGPETVQDFVQMQTQEIQDNIRSRRNKIFLLMEEVRRLRVQQRTKRLKAFDSDSMEENEMPDITSTIPFLSRMTPTTLKQLYLTSFAFVSGIIVFGGLLAPVLELKLGIGGTLYEDFIRNMHLPMQLRWSSGGHINFNVD